MIWLSGIDPALPRVDNSTGNQVGVNGVEDPAINEELIQPQSEAISDELHERLNGGGVCVTDVDPRNQRDHPGVELLLADNRHLGPAPVFRSTGAADVVTPVPAITTFISVDLREGPGSFE